MSDPYIGEIRIFAGNYAPYGWLPCNGQIMQIVQNTALFSLLGTMYGGDGKTTFALPDLRGRAPMDWGRGAGLSVYNGPGMVGGASYVPLADSMNPSHTHSACGDGAGGGQQTPAGNVWGTQSGRSAANLYSSNPPNVNLNAEALDRVGNGQVHYNMQPYLPMMFIIAVQGIYPARD